MQTEELEKKLSIIFDKVLKDQEKGLKGISYLQLSQYLSFNFPDTDMMIDLFAMVQQDEKLKVFFVSILKKQIVNSDEIQWGITGKGFSLKGISPICFLCPSQNWAY